MTGAVLAAASSRLGDDATAVLSRLAGPFGDAARAAARELASLDESARKQHRAHTAALARAPSIAAFRGVHSSWIEVALAELPARARTALAGPSQDPIDVWLARWATAALPPSPAAGTHPVDTILALAPAETAAWLGSVALDQLAFALGRAASEATPALREAAARIARAPRLDALGSQRAALLRCRGAALDDAMALVAIAGRALAPHLAEHPLACLQLTRRLPHAQGLLLECELVAGALAAIEDVPTWSALLAD